MTKRSKEHQDPEASSCSDSRDALAWRGAGWLIRNSSHDFLFSFPHFSKLVISSLDPCFGGFGCSPVGDTQPTAHSTHTPFIPPPLVQSMFRELLTLELFFLVGGGLHKMQASLESWPRRCRFIDICASHYCQAGQVPAQVLPSEE